MIQRSLQNNVVVDAEEEERDQEQVASVMGDIELQNPVAPQTPANTGQVTSQQVARSISKRSNNNSCSKKKRGRQCLKKLYKK